MNVPSVWRSRGENIPALWFVHPVSGPPMIHARVAGTALVSAQCDSQAALKTDLPAGTDGFRKLGVAIDRDVLVDNIEQVALANRRGQIARDVLLSKLPHLDALAAQKQYAPPLAAQRSPLPVQIKALYAEPNNPTSPLYVVAEKTYPPRSARERACPLTTRITGWLMPTADGGFSLVNADAGTHGCEGTLLIGQPLAGLRTADQRFWVMVQYGYESEAYQMVEVGPSEVQTRLNFSAGGC